MDKKTKGQERRMYKNSKVGQRTASHMFSLNLLSFSFFLSLAVHYSVRLYKMI